MLDIDKFPEETYCQIMEFGISSTQSVKVERFKTERSIYYDWLLKFEVELLNVRKSMHPAEAI